MLLFVSHLMGGVDAAPCRMCHGNFPSCKFAEDGSSCPTTGLVDANAAVMAAGTGTIRMVGLVNPSTHPNSTKNRSCLSSPQAAFPGGSAPRQLTSAGDGFTWLVRGLTLTTRREKNRARASWRHLPSAFSVKSGFLAWKAISGYATPQLRARQGRYRCL